MRHTEKCEKALAVLLKRVKIAPQTLYYRGVSPNDEPLYQLLDKACVHETGIVTESQLLDDLIQEQPK